MSKKTKRKKRKKLLSNRVLILSEIICALIFIYAALQLVSIFQDYHRATAEYETLSEQVVIEEAESEYVAKEKEDMEEEVNVLDLPYDYEVPTYSVDLESLKAQNADTIGWIILPDSRINYPIVKSKDNAEYLTTTFEGQSSSSGAIFMDMLCENDFSDENTIIYGHNMKNGFMFRALNDLTDKEYFWRHHIFCIDIGNGFENYEVISCYETVETDLTSWQISFESKDAYASWLETIAKRCTYDCADYDINKNTITLSTCRGQAGGTGRFIVHLQKKD